MAKLDDYDLIARVVPGQILIAPAALMVMVLVPELHSAKNLLSAGAGSLMLGTLLAYLVRGPGALKQDRLYAQWGGKPSTALLLHGHPGLNPETRERYHRFLASTKGPGITLLTAAEQDRDPRRAQELAESAGDWLRKHTREHRAKYPRVRQELVAYGFARNLWGIKPIGLSVSLACAVLEFAAISLKDAELPGMWAIAAISISTIGLAAVWAWGVTPSWVRVHADAYGRALLEACEASPSTSRPRKPRGPATKTAA